MGNEESFYNSVIVEYLIACRDGNRRNAQLNYKKIKDGDKVKITWSEDKFYGNQEVGKAFKSGTTMYVRFQRKDVPADALRENEHIERTEIL